MRCPVCNTKIENPRPNQIYCSVGCNQRMKYKRNPEKFKERNHRWELKNPERTKFLKAKAVLKFRTEKREHFNKLMRDNYKRNKDKWNSRASVSRTLKQKNKKIVIPKLCNICGSKNNLSLKFEVYPLKYLDIKKAVDNKQIYYICKEDRSKAWEQQHID